MLPLLLLALTAVVPQTDEDRRRLRLGRELGSTDPTARAAMQDPDVLACFLSSHANATVVRAARPAHRERRWPLLRRNDSDVNPSCGGVSAVPPLSAPLFFASARPHGVAAEHAPFGMLMDGMPESAMLHTIRQYQRNATLPLRCRYKTCAVVGSSGHLRGADFGAGIDAHTAVFRINAARTHGYESAVGSRTTFRAHNSEKPFMLASLDVPELQLVICHMQWIGACQRKQALRLSVCTSRQPRTHPIIYSSICVSISIN